MELKVEHLSKSFETKEVLKDINFTFEEGGGEGRESS